MKTQRPPFRNRKWPRWAQLCLLAFALLGSFVPNRSDADGSIVGREFRKLRPANFFREEFSRDELVCGPILESLNEPYRRAQGPREEQHSLMYTSYLLDGWRRKQVNWVNADGRSTRPTKDQLIVDINNDGRKDSVYRSRSSLSGIISEYLAISLDPTEDELSDRVLSYDAFRRILEPANPEASGGPVSFTRKTIDVPQAEIPDHDLFWWEVISLNGRSYLMASDAVYWNATAVNSVLEYRDPPRLSLICQFRGILDITH